MSTADQDDPTSIRCEVVAHVINEQRSILATLRRTEPRPLYGVAVAEMGSQPAVNDQADRVAAWQ
jgi:hypothetical protein